MPSTSSLATLSELARDGKIEAAVVQKAIKDLGINPEKPNPAISARRPVTGRPYLDRDMTEFKVPELGENVASGDVTRVLVNVGDTIARDQPVLELETDKATIEVPSSVAGVVKEIKVKKGDKVKVGAVVLTVDDAGRRSCRACGEGRGTGRAPRRPRHQSSSAAAACRRPLLLRAPAATGPARVVPMPVRPAPEAPAQPRRAARSRRASVGRLRRRRRRCDVWRARSASTSTTSRAPGPAAASRRKTSRSTRGGS